MLNFGYSCKDFLNLKELYFDADTSREVLIAIGWLISSYDILETLSKNVLSLYDEEFLKEDDNFDDIANEIDLIKLSMEKNEQKDLDIQLNWIKYLNGRFKSTLNSYYSCLMEKSKLIHKMNSGQTSFKLDKLNPGANLSHFELYLLNNPSRSPKVI